MQNFNKTWIANSERTSVSGVTVIRPAKIFFLFNE